MFNSILSSAGDITASTLALTVLSALVLGIVISFVYMFTAKKGSYSKDFVIAIAILPAIVSGVILVIGTNIASAFSLAGAFALVRFRSAPGSAKDIAIVFLAMAAGLACGLGYVVVGVILAVIILVVLVVLSKTKFGDSKRGVKQLKITIPEDLNYNGAFDDLFAEYTTSADLSFVKTSNMGTLYELTYLVNMKEDKDEKEFIDSIRCRNGNLNISLGMIPDKEMTL